MKRPTRINFQDLLGTPWRDMPCARLALHVLRDRIGFKVPDHAMGVDLGDPGNAERSVEYLRGETCWKEIGLGPWNAKLLGDLIFWPGKPTPHVGVLVDESTRHVLTTIAKGGAHALRSYSIPAAQCKVYRWNPK